jgi:transcriptional regulator with XRE-family HTH domain
MASAADSVAEVPERSAIQRRLGRAVKEVRVSRGLTQEQVSAASGLHPTYISDIERGARNPSWEALTRLAGGIGVSVTEISQRFDAQE